MQGAKNMTCLFSPADFDTIQLPKRILPEMRDILADCAEYFDVTLIDVKSDRKDENSCKPRHAFCWLCFECTHKTLTQIGRHLGRDHTTVSHSLKRAKKMRRDDEHFYNITETLKKQYLAMWR
jgi:chromosomal replication initiator protein